MRDRHGRTNRGETKGKNDGTQTRKDKIMGDRRTKPRDPGLQTPVRIKVRIK